MTRDVGGDKTVLVVGRPIARDLFDDARGVSRLSGSFPGADLGVPRRHVSGRILAGRRVAAALQTRLIEIVDIRLLLDAERHGAIAVWSQDAIRRPSVGLKCVHQVRPRVLGYRGGDAERSARGRTPSRQRAVRIHDLVGEHGEQPGLAAAIRQPGDSDPRPRQARVHQQPGEVLRVVHLPPHVREMRVALRCVESARGVRDDGVASMCEPHVVVVARVR